MHDTKSMVGPDGSFKIYVKKDREKKTFHFTVLVSIETGSVGEAVEVPPDAVVCTWKCNVCKTTEDLTPESYKAGIPVCSVCDTDMEYVTTKVRKGLL